MATQYWADLDERMQHAVGNNLNGKRLPIHNRSMAHKGRQGGFIALHAMTLPWPASRSASAR
jgi:hypothetical protein